MKQSLLLFVALLCTILAPAQQVRVSGIVESADDAMPVIGCNVVIKSDTRGTITDIDGHFELDAKVGDILIVSYMGYKTQEIRVDKNAKPLHIVLESDNLVLEEVVAVGYGKMRKTDLTGAVSTVSADELLKTPASNITTALQGRAAGVTVTNSSGQPGEAATIRIRGIGSAIAGNDPLYVVDGVITSDISFLPANDIESMQILKDASAAAIYGSRGANGVIIITTKSGSQGKANIT
ncbi:MAG: TonB-dependent receptor plug domain-containing protein, partial [Paludibacteraceae bacterium]